MWLAVCTQTGASPRQGRSDILGIGRFTFRAPKSSGLVEMPYFFFRVSAFPMSKHPSGLPLPPYSLGWQSCWVAPRGHAFPCFRCCGRLFHGPDVMFACKTEIWWCSVISILRAVEITRWPPSDVKSRWPSCFWTNAERQKPKHLKIKINGPDLHHDAF